MAAFVLTNVRLFGGGVDFTTRNNKTELSPSVEDKDTTNYGSQGWKERIGGLGDSALAATGQWEAGDLTKVDDQDWANQGAVSGFTICPSDAQVGGTAWLMKAMQASYKLGGTVGDVAPWEIAAGGSWPLSRGLVLHPPGTARTVTGNGTATQLTAVSANQFLYGTLHALGFTDGSMTVIIQSSVDNTFASPTTQLTFSAVGAVGGQMIRAAGPITDTWFRAQWTISGGSTHSFLFLAAIGIK